MSQIDLKEKMKEYEKALILDALNSHKTRDSAAKSLNLGRTTLIEKMRRLGIPLKYLRPRANQSQSNLS